MAPHRAPPPHAEAVIPLTQEDFDALVLELERLRDRHRADFARDLRDARTYGSPGENDDVLTVFEEAAIDTARIAQLEGLLRNAFIVDDRIAFDGRARLGCTVQVHDDRGRQEEYRLVGRRLSDSPPHHVSLASPVGNALMNARVGDIARVALPNGRERELHVLEVAPALPEIPAMGQRVQAA